MFIGNKFVEITCGEDLKIYFEPFDNSLTKRWMNLVDKSNEKNLQITSNYRKIPSIDDVERELQEFNDNISFINTRYDKILPNIKSLDWLIRNPHILNDLHEEYEIYGDRIPNIKIDPLHHSAMIELNNQIHNFEAILQNLNNLDKSHCNALVDWVPTGLHEDLNYEDYFLFTGDLKWGYLYLGYNTLGKSWLPSSFDDDVEVVKRKQIRPQKRFGAEYFVNLFEYIPYNTKSKFHNWWTKNDFSDYYTEKFTIEDFAFGFIPLAKIKCYKTKDGMFSANPMISINTSELQFKWNKEYWSKYNSITSTRIIKDPFNNV
jgi:hypothetical protein